MLLDDTGRFEKKPSVRFSKALLSTTQPPHQRNCIKRLASTSRELISEISSRFFQPVTFAWLPTKRTGSKKSAKTSPSTIAEFILRGFLCAASKLSGRPRREIWLLSHRRLADLCNAPAVGADLLTQRAVGFRVELRGFEPSVAFWTTAL